MHWLSSYLFIPRINDSRMIINHKNINFSEYVIHMKLFEADASVFYYGLIRIGIPKAGVYIWDPNRQAFLVIQIAAAAAAA